nr:unnamed protein product [Digitaria exilis]
MWGERTHHKHWHQGHGSSKDKNHDKRQPKFIPDTYSSVDEVTTALREAGLESSNLILGIDFTKSNEWSGPTSFAPLIYAAISVVENSNWQYHVLVIIADGQFVNFTGIMSTNMDMSKKEAAFALAALMEIPSQYKATQGLRPSEYLLVLTQLLAVLT